VFFSIVCPIELENKNSEDEIDVYATLRKERLRERKDWVAIIASHRKTKKHGLLFYIIVPRYSSYRGKAMHHVYLHCSIPNIHLLGHNNKNALDHPLY